MAVSKNLWLNGTNQKLGGAVTYNLKGQQIIRKEAAKVANPRTTAQMDQRVKLANLVNFYRANKAWMAKGSFESKKQTWSDYNAFVSVNLGNSLVYLTKSQASAGAAICAPYIVTKGTMTPAHVQMEADSETANSVTLLYQASAVPSTWGALSQAIINAHAGIQNGDQLSIIYYMQATSGDNKFLRVKAQELILDVNSTTALTGMFSGWTFEQTGMSFNAVTLDEGSVKGVSICFSRTVSGAIKVSDSQVILLDSTVYDAAITESAIENAIASYGGSSTNFLDSNTTGLSSTPGDSQGGSGAGDPGDVTP